MKILKRILLFVLATVLALSGSVAYKTATFASKQTAIDTLPTMPIEQQSVDNFCKALQYKTISFGDSTLFDPKPFSQLIDYLQRTYPRTHATLKREIVNQYSLLYTWQGTDANLKPIILMGHTDVVPIDETTRNQWKADPFGGQIQNDTIWGRGAVDDKINVIAVLEATERLVKEGYQPKRTIYLSFGHDEEIGGKKGAKKIVEKLQQQNVKAEFILDEGGLLMDGLIPDKVAALIGTAEKGYLSVEITATDKGGHSSTPPAETAIDLLTQSIVTLRNTPFVPHFTQPLNDFMRYAGPEMSLFQRMAFANKWLFSPLIVKTYSAQGKTNAMIRTTGVATILDAGFKENVIPAQAKAVVNFRILPEETSETTLSYIKTLLTDPRISIKQLGIINEPSKVSSVDGVGYKTVEKTIKQVVPNTVVAPFLLPGATDSRHFEGITESTYRHIPARLLGYHDINERISVPDYKRCIAFYYQFIKNANP
jgi:carboxypeptidase PM20D1